MSRFITLVLLIVSLAGCIAVSERPLAPRAVLGADAPILGHWYANDGTGAVFVHVTPGIEEGTLHLVMIEPKQGRTEVEAFTALPARVGLHDYLSLLPLTPDPRDPAGYWIARYRADGEWFELALLGSDPLEPLVRSGEVAGAIDPDGKRGLLLRCDDEQLRVLVERDDPKLFSGLSRLRRLSVPVFDSKGGD